MHRIKVEGAHMNKVRPRGVFVHTACSMLQSRLLLSSVLIQLWILCSMMDWKASPDIPLVTLHVAKC